MRTTIVATPASLPPRQLHSRERPYDLGRSFVHDPLPRVAPRFVCERSVELTRLPGVEDRRDRIAVRCTAGDGGGSREAGVARRVEPQAGILTGMRVDADTHHRLVRAPALRVHR